MPAGRRLTTKPDDGLRITLWFLTSLGKGGGSTFGSIFLDPDMGRAPSPERGSLSAI